MKTKKPRKISHDSKIEEEIAMEILNLRKMQEENAVIENRISESKIKITELRNKQIERVDIKYLGIPNICFSLTDKDDDREEGFRKQRVERGFDNSELWSLDGAIIGFIAPRLKEFAKCRAGFPDCFGTQEQWDEILNKMVKWTELYEKVVYKTPTEKEQEEYEEGKKLFFEYFENLWH